MATEIRTLRAKLSNRTINALVNKWGEGVTLEAVAKAGARELLKTNGFGRAALRELRTVLKAHGLTLAFDDVGTDDVDRAILREREACLVAVDAVRAGDSDEAARALRLAADAIRARGAK